MSATVDIERMTAGRATGRPRWTLVLLRVLLTGQAVLVALQPVLAGRFLSGDVDAIGVHANVAFSIMAVGLATAVAGVLYWIAGRGRFWIVPLSLALLGAEVVQVGLGFTRALHVHVPLGSAIVTVAVVLAGWSWSARAREPRARR